MCCVFLCSVAFHIAAIAIGFEYADDGHICKAPGLDLSLPVYLYVGGLVLLVSNVMIIMFVGVMACTILDDNDVNGIQMWDMTCTVCYQSLFVVAWFIIGVVLYVGLPNQCTDDPALQPLRTMGIVYLVILALALVQSLTTNKSLNADDDD